MNLLKKITTQKIFSNKPIVLIHIGADGSKFEIWKNIAQNSILILVDPTLVKKNKKIFLKILYVDKVISNKNSSGIFYNTRDPHCSSLLEPNFNEYTKWYGAHRFKVIKKIKTKVYSLNKVLKDLKINYIDWLVIDAQGLDSKIFNSISKKIRSQISIVDLEPGFFNFYKNGDKISEIFKSLNSNFEFEDMSFGYNYKVDSKKLTNFDKKILFRFNKPSKIYSNIIFLNKNNKNLRILLLKIIYLLIHKKFYEARNLILMYSNNKISKFILDRIDFSISLYKVIYIFLLPYYLVKKIIKKILNK